MILRRRKTRARLTMRGLEEPVDLATLADRADQVLADLNDVVTQLTDTLRSSDL